MKLVRSREHVINMGQYESVRVGSSVELDFDDAMEGPTSFHEKSALAGAMLAEAMKPDLEEAIDLLPPGSKSYVLSWGVK